MEEGKKELRKKMINLRYSLTQEEISRKSRRIFERLMSLGEYEKSGLIMGYMDFRNEVRTCDFIRDSLEMGKRVAIPYVTSMRCGIGEIAASEIYDMKCDTAPGRCGILEPAAGRLRIVNPGEIDLAVVPGVAFDKNGFRLGYGAGCYDGFLKNVRSDCLKVGVAFEIQIVEVVPTDEHDIPLDIVITEDRLIYRQYGNTTNAAKGQHGIIQS